MKKIFLVVVLASVKIECIAQKEIIVKDLNPLQFELDFKNYSQNSALYCAQLSNIAYWDSLEIKRFYKKMVANYPDENIQYKIIDDNSGSNHIQALLWCTKRFLVIAFRGTEPKRIKNWYSDSKFFYYENLPEKNEELSYIPGGHAGFRRALIGLMVDKNIFNEIDLVIQKSNQTIDRKQFPIYLTGHSLGAGISQLFIHPLHYRKYNFSGAYHFAPPLAVSCEINQQMRNDYGNITYDVVNYKDYVPRAGRNNVAHFGKFYRICNDGLIYKENEAYVKFKLSELKDEFKLHSIKNHILYIGKNENKLENIIKRSTGNFPCMELEGQPSNLCGN